MKKFNSKGFTIVELVIVIAVIAILAAVLIPTFSGIIEKAQDSALQQEAAAIWKEAYALDLSDGTLDGKEGKKAVALEDKNFAYHVDANGGWTFGYANDEKVAQFKNNSEWKVVEHKDDACVVDKNDKTGDCHICGKAGVCTKAEETTHGQTACEECGFHCEDHEWAATTGDAGAVTAPACEICNKTCDKKKTEVTGDACTVCGLVADKHPEN